MKVLLVEDTDSDAELLGYALQKAGPGQFALSRVETWADASACLRDGGFEVLLLDLFLPDSRGTETVLRARAEAPHIPIIVLTGSEDESLALEAMRRGIEEFLIKGNADGRLLARTIRYSIERRRAEETLRHNQELLRAVIEGTPDAIYAKDLEGRYVLVNEAAARLAGKPRHELLGTFDDSVFLPDEVRSLQEIDRTVVTTGKTVTSEETLTTAVGLRTFLSTKGPLRDDAGETRGVFGISHDVSEIKRAEKHLQGMAALLKLFAGRSSRKEYLHSVVKLLKNWCECQCVGVRLLDDDGLLPYAAQQGFSRDFLEQELKLCINSGACACVRLLSEQPRVGDGVCCSSGGSFVCNHTSQYVAQIAASPKAAGEVACVKLGYESIAHAPLRYHGELLGSLHLADPHRGKFAPEIVAFIEATAPLIAEAIHRFGVEQSLVESESRFRSMFERHASVMLLVSPETGAIVDANPAAVAFYGYSQEQLRGMNLDTIQEHTTRAQHGPHLSLPGIGIFTHYLANGERRSVEAHSSHIRVRQQRLLFCIIHDVTERMVLQKAVLDITEKERQRVGQDLHDSLGGKLTGAALMGKALSQKLAALGLPEAGLAQEVVECINDSIRQTRAIAHNLHPVDLTGSGLSGALAGLAAETERHSGVQCYFHADKTFRITDRFVALHLFRLAMEAVTNALRHAQPHTITILLKTTPVEVLLEVRDDGKGISADWAEAGGLGLRTMKYRADTIGGQLSIQPGPAGGTVVCCALPTRWLEAGPKDERV